MRTEKKTDKPMPKILVEGWRFIPNSFALVNQFQCLELLKRPNINLYHHDVPLWNPEWKQQRGLLPAFLESKLDNIPTASETPCDITLRMGCPFDFSKSQTERLIVFATCEFGIVTTDAVAGNIPLGEALANKPVSIITPSQWSMRGLINSGASADQIAILPHGVDPLIFKPLAKESRIALRKKLGWEGSFIFLNIGAMTPNKGIPSILSAVLTLIQQGRKAKLVLKGIDSLYSSSQRITNMTQSLSQTEMSSLAPHVNYVGRDCPITELACYYQAADAYVSPYTGEGFNMPVLEAMACGLPVICTKGGPTDDFTRPDFSRLINSNERKGKDGKIILQPDSKHLIEIMQELMDDPEWVAKARHTAPLFVANHYTWKHIIDRLLKIMFDEEPNPT